jgi:predicted small lipoprotein YifL
VRRAALVCLVTLTACGAKTPLAVPDPPDGGAPATPDGASDGAECGADRDCDDRIDCTADRCAAGRCAHEPVDASCDDGLFCNGVDRCIVGFGCAASAPACGDAIECTADRCDEELDACVHEPDPASCPISHRCDPIAGCVARALAHDATFIMEIDLPSGELHTLGAHGAGLTDIALHPDGTLYGAIPGALVRVDYTRALVERLVDVEGNFVALDIAPDGTLYGASDDRLDLLDPIAGTAATVARFPPGTTASGDLAIVGGRFLATAFRTLGGIDLLVELFVDGRRAQIVGSTGRTCVFGLAPLGDTLYGLDCNGGLSQIDLATGRATVLTTTSTSFYGAGAR